MIEKTCPIWGTTADVVKRKDWVEIYSSDAGGLFFLTEETYEDIVDQGGANKIAKLNKVKIATYILQQNIKNSAPQLTYNDLEIISQSPFLDAREKYNLLLKTIKWSTPNIGEDIGWQGSSEYLTAIEWGEKDKFFNGVFDENTMLLAFLNEAIEKQHINYSGKSLEDSAYTYLTIKGHQYIEEMGHQLLDSDQIFVAMWFNDQTRPLYEKAIKPAIKQAGYKVMRIDDKSHNEKICDEIIAEIRKSKALVADMTCGLAKPEEWSEENLVGAPRGGVFYEAGFAHGLGIPVIWTVNQEIADIENVSHFDVRQYNQIRWTKENLEEAKKEILNRIEATLGQGPHLEQN